MRDHLPNVCTFEGGRTGKRWNGSRTEEKRVRKDRRLFSVAPIHALLDERLGE